MEEGDRRMREARGSYECGRKVVWCKELKTMMFYGGGSPGYIQDCAKQ